jgi:fructokinase
MTRKLHLGVETGGTKIVARLAHSDGAAVADARWPTTTPNAACDDIVGFVRANALHGALAGAGMAAFGPIIVDPDGDLGRVLATPKPDWSGSNLRRDLSARLGIDVAVDTDVNAAAIAEQAIGAGRDCASLAYLTIGTGIGAGLALSGTSLRGALHPELGHLRLVRAAGDLFASTCPYHEDCAEGLAAGPAVQRRLSGSTLGARPDVRDLIAGYLGQLVGAIILAWSPHRIVIGGGVGSAPGVIEAITQAYPAALGGYGVGPRALEPGFLVSAALADAGLAGALLMAGVTCKDLHND